MDNLIFGLGKTSVQTRIDDTDKKVILGRLQPLCITGDTFSDDDCKEVITLNFQTEAGLDILIEALQHCKAKFVYDRSELRMGA